MSDITFACQATSLNDFQELPDCLLWTMTDGEREDILDTAAIVKERNYTKTSFQSHFEAIKGIDEQIIAVLEGEELVPVDDLKTIANCSFMRIECLSIGVTRDNFKLRCYDAYSGNVIETPYIPLDVLQAEHNRSGETEEAEA